ncbi:hypothetical protein [Xenorhabdus bovienii]|uniref:hypothetical protein n=1 Tax=Xenorhabdus bovienii TaxID=40576 RepID=UPI00237CA039|nr:hypothetical protein [Xenorhabdus bovienii]MDE1487064.1 hypothetical protein [Xenorhabdus bovienii]
MALSEWFVFFRRISSRKTGSSKNIVNNLRAQQQIALSSLVLEPFQHGHWNSQISR